MTPNAVIAFNRIGAALAVLSCFLSVYTFHQAYELRRQITDHYEMIADTVFGIRVSQIDHAKVVSTFSDAKDPQFDFVSKVLYVVLKDGTHAVVHDRAAMIRIIQRMNGKNVEFVAKTLGTE